MEKEKLIPKHGGYRKLLTYQLASLGAAFEREGGFRERLYRVRSARRTGK